MATIRKLLRRLEDDPWRREHPFSADINTACDVLLNPYARDDERRIAICGWLAKFQPCVFGQVAAKSNRLFISIVDEKLLDQGDKAVKEKLQSDRRTWKQWSLGEKGKHGFLLVVLSPKLHYAAPNQALRGFAEHVRSLFAADSKPDPVGNDMVYEWLYLKNPRTGQFHKFRVILDFFASAGDARWWHDHRFPGGIAFTFNSLGHMTRTREWYENNTKPVDWAAQLAMHTIGNAFPHAMHGKATWLLDLNANKPVKSVKCPFANPEAVADKIKGKDWTTYQGYHHTDHSVRAEFFDGRENSDRSRGPYLMDFSYIGGGDAGENMELMNGIVVDENELFEELGPVEDWRFAKPLAKAALQPSRRRRPKKDELRIAAALKLCNRWLRSRIRL